MTKSAKKKLKKNAAAVQAQILATMPVRPVYQPGAKGGGKGAGKDKGAAKGGKLKSVTPDGKPICYKYNNGQPCDSQCGRVHVCQFCFGLHAWTAPCPNKPAGM